MSPIPQTPLQCLRLEQMAYLEEPMYHQEELPPVLYPLCYHISWPCRITQYLNGLKMNISETEVPVRILAKTCGCNKKNIKKVTYQLIDSYHSLCLDKKELMYAELEACERLLKYTADVDKKIIESEIKELKMALDLMT